MKKGKSVKELLATKVEVGSGSVYADLKFQNYAEMETKANLVLEISKAVKKKKITQVQAADIFGISQPKLSELLNGHFRGYSVERLIHFLNLLDHDVDIVIKAKPRNRKARVSVYHSNPDCRPTIPIAAKRY